MGTGSTGEASDSAVPPSPPPAAKACIACAELINPAAAVCPYCTTHQAHRRLRLIAETLKWAAGIASVVGIVTTAVQLYKLVQPALEKQAAARQMVRAATQQQRVGNHESAKLLIAEALKLDPASLDAMKERVQIAMDQVRRLMWLEEKEEAKLDPLLLELYKGLGFEKIDKSLAANAFAHLGWLNHLRQDRSNSYPDTRYFERAVELDPVNPFAHVFWAGVCRDECNDPIAHAVGHFDVARKSGRAADFVGQRTFIGLCGSNLARAWPHCFAFLGRTNDEAFLSPEEKKDIVEKLSRILIDERRFSEMRAVETEAQLAGHLLRLLDDPTFTEIIDGESIPYSRYLWEARIKDLNGDTQGARILYGRLRNKLKMLFGRSSGGFPLFQASLSISMARMIGAHLGTLGLTWDTFRETEVLGLEDKWAMQIQAVNRDGPANKAGIQPGDLVIAINEEAITSASGRFLLASALAGEVIILRVWRRGEGELSIPLTLAKRPFDEPTLKELISLSSFDLWYLEVAVDKALYGDSCITIVERKYSVCDVTDILRQEFDLPRYLTGAFILNSSMGSRPIAPGDVILEINGVAVRGATDFLERREAIRASNERFVFTRYRDGEVKTLTF